MVKQKLYNQQIPHSEIVSLMQITHNANRDLMNTMLAVKQTYSIVHIRVPMNPLSWEKRNNFK